MSSSDEEADEMDFPSVLEEIDFDEIENSFVFELYVVTELFVYKNGYF